eukprot:9831420-Alexandrium_andersonii.AAC.1
MEATAGVLRCKPMQLPTEVPEHRSAHVTRTAARKAVDGLHASAQPRPVSYTHLRAHETSAHL